VCRPGPEVAQPPATRYNSGMIDTVSRYLCHDRAYPEWWPVPYGAPSDDLPVSASLRYALRAPLPYRLPRSYRPAPGAFAL